MTAIINKNMNVLNALNTSKEQNLYLFISKYTAWPDEQNPPIPDINATTIEELIYIKKIEVKHLVKVNDGIEPIDAQVNNINWNYVQEENAFLDNAHFLYLSTSILFSDIAPTNTNYRQVGVIRNPKNSDGVLLTNQQYLAADVANIGEILYIDNRGASEIPIIRNPVQSEKIDIILTF